MNGGGGGGHQAFSSSLTDLMTSLAVIFILLLVVFLKHSHDQAERAKRSVEVELAQFLKQRKLELRQDPDDPLTLNVAVGEEYLKFALGSAALPESGDTFLNGFFRRFAGLLCGPKLRDQVDAVIIEGHTDRSGEKGPGGVGRNIVLSQSRSYAVLERALKSVQGNPDLHECLLKRVAATGKGSRSPMLSEGEYDAARSRRVEIKIRVRSTEQQLRGLVGSADAGPIGPLLPGKPGRAEGAERAPDPAPPPSAQ